MLNFFPSYSCSLYTQQANVLKNDNMFNCNTSMQFAQKMLQKVYLLCHLSSWDFFIVASWWKWKLIFLLCYTCRFIVWNFSSYRNDTLNGKYSRIFLHPSKSSMIKWMFFILHAVVWYYTFLSSSCWCFFLMHFLLVHAQKNCLHFRL